jgi:hypothetical protein
MCRNLDIVKHSLEGRHHRDVYILGTTRYMYLSLTRASESLPQGAHNMLHRQVHNYREHMVKLYIKQ